MCSTSNSVIKLRSSNSHGGRAKAHLAPITSYLSGLITEAGKNLDEETILENIQLNRKKAAEWPILWPVIVRFLFTHQHFAWPLNLAAMSDLHSGV